MNKKKTSICIIMFLLIISLMNGIKADDPMYTLTRPEWLLEPTNTTIFIDDQDILNTDFVPFMSTSQPRNATQAGESFSIDGLSGTTSQKIVYCLYDKKTEGQHLVFHFIFNELFIIENRSIHTAYVTIPTIDVFINGEWRTGVTMGGAFINTNVTLPKTYIGCYGYGLCFSTDHIIPFKIICKVYVQNESNPSLFDLDNLDISRGLWIYDIVPRPINIPLNKSNELIMQGEELVIC